MHQTKTENKGYIRFAEVGLQQKASIGVDIGADPIHFNGDFFFVLLGSKDVAARSFRASGGDK